MLRHTSKIDGYTIGASDGQIGSVTDFLFDEASWRVRWLVVDTGTFLSGRKVLLPPSALSHVNHIGHQLAVNLTKQQVKDSPDIKSDEPVSGQMETDLYDYYGWSPYWYSGFYMGGYGYVGGPFVSRSRDAREREDEAVGSLGDRHLRSVKEVSGYHIHARDGEIGHVADFLLEDGDWSVRYLIVDTRNWWPGKKVLISPHSIESVSWSTRMVNLDVDREKVKNSPAYDGSEAIDRAYEYQYHGYYDGRRVPEPV